MLALFSRPYAPSLHSPLAHCHSTSRPPSRRATGRARHRSSRLFEAVETTDAMNPMVLGETEREPWLPGVGCSKHAPQESGDGKTAVDQLCDRAVFKCGKTILRNSPPLALWHWVLEANKAIEGMPELWTCPRTQNWVGSLRASCVGGPLSARGVMWGDERRSSMRTSDWEGRFERRVDEEGRCGRDGWFLRRPKLSPRMSLSLLGAVQTDLSAWTLGWWKRNESHLKSWRR